MVEKTFPKHVCPIADDFYESCVESAESWEENPRKVHIGYPSKTAGYKIVYTRLEGVKKGIIKRIWHDDPLLGTKEFRLIQVDTGKVVVRASEVDKVIGECYKRIGTKAKCPEILDMVKDTYCGIGREQIKNWLRRMNELTYSTRAETRETLEMEEVEEVLVESEGTDHQLLGKYKPLPDDLYDCISRSLAGIEKLPKHGHPLYQKTSAWMSRHQKFCRSEWVNVEGWSDAGGRWEIVENVSGRVIPREHEVEEIVIKYYQIYRDMVVEGKAQKKDKPVHDLIKKHYTGIGAKRVQEILNRVEKGGGRLRTVVFPARPKVETTHPMQHIQIDIIGMKESEYSNKIYDHLVFVQCLFSRFWFTRALPSKDDGLITRHLLDIIGTFGPPEAYQAYTDLETVSDCMTDVATVFGVHIQNLGRSGISDKGAYAHYALRKRIYAKTVELFGEDIHWVEALPFAVIEENQRPTALLNSKFTPFEVMFARQPWPGSVLPPWIKVEEKKRKGRNQSRADSTFAGGGKLISAGADETFDPDLDVDSNEYVDYGICEEDTYWKRTLCDAQMKQYGQRQEEIRNSAFEIGQWRVGSYEPPTGVLYCPGDEVFVKNPLWEDWWVNRNSSIPRYFKGIIVERNIRRSLPYKVRWTELDEDDPEMNQDDEFMNPDDFLKEAWVSVYDVVGTTRDLEDRRKIKAGSLGRKPGYLCQCPDPNCRAFSSKACENGMAKNCCLSLMGGCGIHVQPLLLTVPPEDDVDGQIGAALIGEASSVSRGKPMGLRKTVPEESPLNEPLRFEQTDLEEQIPGISMVEEISCLDTEARPSHPVLPNHRDTPSTSVDKKNIYVPPKREQTLTKKDSPSVDWLSEEAVKQAKAKTKTTGTKVVRMDPLLVTPATGVVRPRAQEKGGIMNKLAEGTPLVRKSPRIIKTSRSMKQVSSVEGIIEASRRETADLQPEMINYIEERNARGEGKLVSVRHSKSRKRNLERAAAHVDTEDEMVTLLLKVDSGDQQ